MNHKRSVGLTSTEVAALWSTYMSESMTVCLTKVLLTNTDDQEVKALLSESLTESEGFVKEITRLFTQEEFPIPRGYTDEDINLSAPPLFFNLFPLSYAYGLSRLGMVSYGLLTSSVAREDLRAFFSKCLTSSLKLYNQCVELMLSKGIYDRPAYIPYPEHIEFLKKKETFISKWFEPQRSLNVLELSDMFFNIERNYFGVILLTGFIQVVKDNEIKQYLLKGKKLAEKQIEFMNKTLSEEDLLGNIMVNTAVTASTVSPFSDRLILGLISLTNTQGILYTGHAISMASRVDLAAEYMQILLEILQNGKQGMEMLIERQWMEEPPHAPDRKALANAIK
ncbi:DUF3231 family protein [Paenibacillus eucommiae]|uniref:Spore coat protein CotF n=1 Tax=Paenibacillus eucommiae TaxID=1355755 RepID=A0ABS4IQ62_9BACL|nr:DUF3231 family protein [Paenibacillus eucommiae]MBP1989161.1 spore coat protein CotF [Paenibacillus eucommiae]